MAHQEDNNTSVNEESTINETNETPSAAPSGDAAAQPVESASDQAQEYLAGWQRTRAEFANYKKRVEREMKDSARMGSLDAVSKVLPIIDDFERALNNVPDDLQDNAWVSGMTLLFKKFEKLLAESDVTILDPVGQPFDPNQHEAIGMDESDTVESGHVTVTLQKGYVSGDKILRPALVRVAN